MGEGPWLAGPALSLADLHGASMIDYFRLAPEGLALIERHPRMAAWWDAVADRMAAVRAP
jgi:glutathione S-transferase